MKNLFLSLLFFVSVSVFAQCDNAPIIKFIDVEYKLDTSMSVKDLQGTIPGFVMGLTESNEAVFWDLVKVGDCERFVFNVGYVDVIVSVPYNFPEGSCPYNHVLAHELHHVEIYKTYLENNLEKMKYIVSGINKQNFDSEIKGIADNLSKVLADVKHEHEHFDSPQEYSKTRTACNGNLMKLAKVK